MTGLLRNKVVAITGASSGIGRATAIACTHHGARLFLHHIDTPTGNAEISSLLTKLPPSTTTFGADLLAPDTPKELISRAISDHGRIDVLVNNAGIATFSKLADVTPDLLHRHIATNFTAAYLLTQAAAEHMRGGSIVNIASITALLGSKNLSHYSASKAALLGMTVSCAVELGPDVRVNAVCPGTTETRMNEEDLKGGKREMMASRVPMGRLGRPDDIADAVVFFASDLSRYVTGQYLLVDGGASISYQ